LLPAISVFDAMVHLTTEHWAAKTCPTKLS